MRYGSSWCIKNVRYKAGPWVLAKHKTSKWNQEKVRQDHGKIYYRIKSSWTPHDSTSRALCNLTGWATPPLTSSPFTSCLNPHLPRSCFASLGCRAPRFGGSSAEDSWLCWGGIPVNGKPMRVSTGLREGDGKMLCMVGPGEVSCHVAYYCKKTRNMMNVPSLRPSLGSYVNVFSGVKKASLYAM